MQQKIRKIKKLSGGTYWSEQPLQARGARQVKEEAFLENDSCGL